MKRLDCDFLAMRVGTSVVTNQNEKNKHKKELRLGFSSFILSLQPRSEKRCRTSQGEKNLIRAKHTAAPPRLGDGSVRALSDDNGQADV